MSNDVFWKRNEKFVALLKPIADTILKLEADSAVLSDCITQYSDMKARMENNLAESPLTKAEEKR